jgi:DNA-binding response OmpR family regulator
MPDRPRLLVADPDAAICRLLRRHFDSAIYAVITAQTGYEAFELMRCAPPHLAILSTDLDDIGGSTSFGVYAA